MFRLFVALRPSIEIRTQLIGLMGGIESARWQDDDQLHLTLRFIGEVDRPLAEDIALALSSIRHPPISMQLNGLGSFDRRGTIDTLWAGVTPHEGLAALHRKIDQVLVRLGLLPEGRAYLPHITLARFNRHGGDASGFIAQNGGLTSPMFTCDWFALYESQLTRDRAHYEVVERYPLS